MPRRLLAVLHLTSIERAMDPRCRRQFDRFILIDWFFANHSGRSVESRFIEYKIPYVLIGGVTLFGAKHVKDVLSLLRILANRNDETAWMRYLQLWPGVGEKTAG
jgi:DNA helicase-2/ATP-dependent DNA helicase PcrA